MTNDPTSKDIKKTHPGTIFILGLVTALFSIPIFIIVYQYVPAMTIPIGENGFRVDHILVFLVIFVLLFLFIKRFRNFFIAITIIGLLVITVLDFSGAYPLKTLYHDYSSLLYGIGGHNIREKFQERNESFSRESALIEAIDYNNPITVNYARNIATDNFQEFSKLGGDRRWVQYFSIFKEIKTKWIYVFDPLDEEYFSKTSETIELLKHNDKFKGDCDDYSIVTAGCIRAIGGEVRLVRTEVTMDDGRVIGHLYPEVKIGDEKDLENVTYLLKNMLFPKEIGDRPIHYYVDPKGFVWLNFDYNDPFPGGRYQSDLRLNEMGI